MKNFNVIIGLMLFALIALIGFQWYWIENAVTVKRDQFDRKVIDAMNKSVAKIEKQEVLFLANQKIKEQENLTLASLAAPSQSKKVLKRVLKKKKSQDLKPVNTVVSNKASTPINKNKAVNNPHVQDSIFIVNQYMTKVPALEEFSINIQLSDAYFDERNILPQNRLAFVKRMMQQQNMAWQQLNNRNDEFQTRNESLNLILNEIDREFQSFVNAQQPFLLNPGPQFAQNQFKVKPSTTTKSQTPVNQNNKVAATKEEPEYEWVEIEEKDSGLERSRNKANLVKDVFSDYIQGNRDINERLNQEMLDTLLRQELTNNGIDIPYEYGVKNNGNIMFASFGLDNNPELADLAYNVRLFPNDALQQQQFLYVFIPNKENFIMGNMWAIFGSSLLMILMIGGIFYSSVSTMLEQKKLSVIKNDFINNMTHEFKTPISTISLAVEVMKDKSLNLNPEKYLNIIKHENSRLGTQVEKVLQMALLDKGEVRLNEVSVNIHDTIERVCQNLGVQIEKNNGTLTMDLKASNPNIMADEVHMTNIIYNLIDNANKYAKEIPEIFVSTEDKDGGVSVTVRDNGIGMGKDHMTKIFDKFYRISTGNVHDVKGFGLGLSYVKKMMDMHGGKIEVKSTLGKGSTFVLSFPRISIS
jgi:two-component system, OmpR family, phosphate regulon sensor histidine kinase PhoR